jgi:hypothetical protein
MEIIALSTIFLLILSGALYFEARILAQKHNESIEALVTVFTIESDKTLQRVATHDDELLKTLRELKTSAHAQAVVLDRFVKNIMAPTIDRKKEEPVVPTFLEKRQKNITEFIYTLELAKEKFTKSPFERRALTGVINRIKENV